MAQPRPAAAAESSTCGTGRGNTVSPTSILDGRQFSSSTECDRLEMTMSIAKQHAFLPLFSAIGYAH